MTCCSLVHYWCKYASMAPRLYLDNAGGVTQINCGRLVDRNFIFHYLRSFIQALPWLRALARVARVARVALNALSRARRAQFRLRL